MIQLRPYQTEAIDRFRSSPVQRGVIVLPTGCGKTIMGLSLAKQVGGRTLWLAHREELISQPIKSLRAVWPEMRPGVVKAERNEYARDFVFASIQTAHRDNRLQNLNRFDLVIADESHHSTAGTWQKVIEHVGCFEPGGPRLLGLTATPERTDGIGLDNVFEETVYQYQMLEAIKDGYLVPPRMTHWPIKVDLDAVKVSGGDFNGGALDTALLEGEIVREVADAWQAKAENRKSIIFTVSIAQAELIAEELKRRGVAADHISGETPKEQRRHKIKDFESGKIWVLVNVMVLSEGFDEPSVGCIQIARPTKSKSLYVQMIGRGLRLHMGKSDCIFIDMVALSKKHTLMQAPVIFGDVYEDETGEEKERRERDEILSAEYHEKALLRQVNGTDNTFARSAMQWIHVSNERWALAAGSGGTVLMDRQGDEGWTVRAVGKRPVVMLQEPVEQHLAMGVAEDYVRRSDSFSFASRGKKWRSQGATPSQLAALERMRIETPENCTRGEASDLITKSIAKSPWHEPATEKQLAALRRMGLATANLTKGDARNLINQNRRW